MIFQFPNLAINNRQVIEQSELVGCYHCLKIFEPKEVKEYTDNKKTSICPYCNVDAVIGDKCGFILNEEILIKANKFWF